MWQVLADGTGVVAVEMVAQLVFVREPELALGTLVNGHACSVALLVRPETAADAPAVHAVHAAAFGRALEADLYDALRLDGDTLPLSRVGVADGAIVGSVVCSRAWVGEVEVVALGPVGVLPAWQRQGVGSALVRAVVAAATGEPLLALLGDPAYYGRFGFAPDPLVAPPDPAWAEHFQVLRLRDPSPTGTFRYARAFDGV